MARGGAPPRALIVAGEVSGDHQGALLAAALRRRRPDLALSGVGGPARAAAGVDVLIETLRWGVIGYLEAYVRLPVFAVRFWRLVRLVERTRPDLLVLVDFPGVNRELVRHFSGRVPMVYFFPPQTYARRGRSAARMARAAIRLLAVFPFEAETYRRAGAGPPGGRARAGRHARRGPHRRRGRDRPGGSSVPRRSDGRGGAALSSHVLDRPPVGRHPGVRPAGIHRAQHRDGPPDRPGAAPRCGDRPPHPGGGRAAPVGSGRPGADAW